MTILIKTIRVYGFRGLQNIEVDLEQVTVLTGMNNTGKTSLLKAVQIALGNRLFITPDDYYSSETEISDKIIIDIKVVPIGDNSEINSIFSEDWEVLFTESRVKIDDDGYAFVPMRTIVTYDIIRTIYRTKQYTLPDWPPFENEEHVFWHQTENGNENPFHIDEIPFFYIDAQRDIINDMKARKSSLGKMISQIEYPPEKVNIFEQLIKELNEQLISTSPVLLEIKTTLEDLGTAMDTAGNGVEITPLTKKIRDLNKGLSIYYGENEGSFSMEYHGMGTRSWSSLLTLKAFINLLYKNAERQQKPLFPILTIEEPEAHLHPNAQKKLYSQIEGINGQKIISTHSPFIAASADLSQLRSFYKDDLSVSCGKIKIEELSDDDIRKIKRQVINTRGELFFSKAVVFFEGETEEQILPILAEHFFQKNTVEMGINFIGVDGHGNYLPFLRVTEALKIPWFIFSDAEESVKRSVRDQFGQSNSIKQEADVIVFLDDNNNFEKQLLHDGYSDEVKLAIMGIEIPNCRGPQHEEAKKREIEGYDHDKIYEKLDRSKTKLASLIAYAIIENQKQLPPKVVELFEKIQHLLKRRDEDE